MNKPSNLTSTSAICAVGSVGLATTAAYLHWGAITPTADFVKTPIQTAIGVLLMSFVVAAILERALSVINMAIFPGQEVTARLQHKKALTGSMASALVHGKATKDHVLNIGRTREALEDIKVKKSHMRLCFGFFASVMVAASGFQVLGFFVDPSPMSDAVNKIQAIEATNDPLNKQLGEILTLLNTAQYQLILFNFMDIILTAGLLAGGSEGIAKLISYLKDILDQNSSTTQAQRLASPVMPPASSHLPSTQIAAQQMAKNKKKTTNPDATNIEFDWLITPIEPLEML